MDTQSGSEETMLGDPDRIARDYAKMRIELMDASDLVGVCEQDVASIISEFHTAQKNILVKVPKTDRRIECSYTVDFDMKVRSIMSRLRQPVVKSTKSSDSLAKLPKISIKPFDGKLENWVSFKDLYDSLIHRRDLPDVEKLHYLLSSVQGLAYDLIKSYPLSDASYLLAYQALNSYFDRKRNIAINYYDKLLNCEGVKNKSGSELERVHRTFSENLAILSKYSLPNQDFMLFHLVWSKLDVASREAFELQLDSDVDIPQYDDLMLFIKKRSRALENCLIQPVQKPSVASKKNKIALVVAPPEKCIMCTEVGHTIDDCSNFLKLSASDRFQTAKEKKLCILCLRLSHTVRRCTSKVKCTKCKNNHHTLLHFNEIVAGSVPEAQPSTSQVALAAYTPHTEALFSTAIVLIKNKFNELVRVRILLDSASACNFITRACAQRLGLKISYHAQSVKGIGQVSTEVLGSVNCEIVPTSGDSSNKLSLEASVLPSICSDMPAGKIDISSWHHIKGLDLADPEFFKPGPVDMLVSVNVLASVLKPGLVRGRPGQPIAIPTIVGWIVMGECAVTANSTRFQRQSKGNHSCFFVSNLDNTIKRFWELETVDPPKPTVLSKEELACENYMESSSRRTPQGRLVVPLTFTDPQNKPLFSNSREIAQKRFLNLERKFNVNSQFKNAYVEFMTDYLKSGHMEEVAPPSSNVGHFYYIPHHGILRPGSATTPLRTVFDASATDAEGRSLNDMLLPGPKLQKSIFDLLIRFRWHAVVFTGDIKQMYRQFLVSPSDADYQRILWRTSPDLPMRDFRLLTVTYGVSCAPYQALWCIAHLAKKFATRAPLGAAVLDRDTYVDDVVSGSDTVEAAVRIRQELLAILSSAGLHLRKWTSNHEKFFDGLAASDLYVEQFHNFEDIQDVSLKILGMMWLPKADSLTFKTAAVNSRCTKRSILSDIARIFDPLGLLSPVVFLAKYIMQLLWLSGADWDEDAPLAVSNEWVKFKTQLPLLNAVSLPRRIIPSFSDLQFHGFCDASERGYCAVIYCRATVANQPVVVRLCCAKSKVAPLRKRSIPRLELMAAVLLSELMSSVAISLEGIHRVDNIFAWSDSSVALTWIKSCPSRWKTFVANRVTEIQDNIPPDCWRHVSTNDNPADHGSRGLLPADLVPCEAWWSGPTWLSLSQEDWPQSLNQNDGSALEEQRMLSLFTANNAALVDDILNRFSSYKRVVHIMAYCFRYINNLRNPKTRSIGPLSCVETSAATKFLVKHVQESEFASEIRALTKNTPNLLPKASRKLCPFLDEGGLLRVGGRLSHSQLGYDQKHPLLLPRAHRLTSLLIEEYHKKFLHPGLQTLQNLLAQDFWILSPKRAIRSVISSCVKCFRVTPRLTAPPRMGELPIYRISQLKPFSSASVDYAGPFDISLGRGRSVRTYKGYVCVFVCTATKAVHLELASELTSEAYLACLRRFMARRGRCSRLVSDQGRNFVGASNLLKDLMAQATQAEQVEFVFNPPGSPHFSGLAEAGVKSMKTHLARVVGLQRLTYEEFNTLLVQIEALLNSRPLSPLSSDPNDLSVLTPGHFLTLEPLTILPQVSTVDTKINVLRRWQLIQKMHQDFWRKWHLEYMHTLQQRHKWSDAQPNIAIGTLVLIANEQCSPMKWRLGRVTQLHAGADKICRVVTLRTATGECKRPVVKLCILPMVASDQTNSNADSDC